MTGGTDFTLDAAHDLARTAHAGQVDKQGRDYYTYHLLPVMDLVLADGGDERDAMTALLHDIIEDTDHTVERLRAAGVPEDVIDGVDRCTRRPGEPYFDRIRIAAAHPRSRRTKKADNRRNWSQLPALALTDPATAASLDRRYVRAYAILTAADAD